MPLGSSSLAPVMRPGPSAASRPCLVVPLGGVGWRDGSLARAALPPPRPVSWPISRSVRGSASAPGNLISAFLYNTQGVKQPFATKERVPTEQDGRNEGAQVQRLTTGWRLGARSGRFLAASGGVTSGNGINGVERVCQVHQKT